MPRYYAHFVVRSGRRRKIKVDSVNEDSLSEEIESIRKGYVVEICRVEEKGRSRGELRISSRMLLAALDSLELMLLSGVRINSAVRTLAECAPPGKARSLWTELQLLIEETGSFCEAVRHFPRVFNEAMVGIIAAHENAGCLPEGIVIVRGYVVQMQDIRREAKRGAAYPVLVSAVGAAAFIILCEFTLPRFSKMLVDIGVKKTNRVTEFFFGLSDLIVRHPSYLGLALCIPAALIYLGSMRGCRPVFDRVLLRLPVVCSAIEALAMARICSTFRALSESGIKVLEVLDSCAVAAGNTVYSKGVYDVIAAVKENASIGSGFERAGIFAPEVVMAVKSAEMSLPRVFSRLADYYSSESKHRIALAVRLIEPVMLILVLGWVFGVALAVILPVVEIINGIH
jgi:type II secretory pathway component PulF